MYGIFYWPKIFQFLYYQIITPRKYDNMELARYVNAKCWNHCPQINMIDVKFWYLN